MAKAGVELTKTDSILGELEQVHQQISRRAYDLFRTNGSPWSSPLENWLNAERELVWQPAVEVRQKNNQFEVLAALAGVDPKDLDIQVTPDHVLIQANVSHEHTSATGTVHLCEFSSGRLFRAIQFPERIDPERVKADYRNGLLRLTATVAKTSPKKVDVQIA